MDSDRAREEGRGEGAQLPCLGAPHPILGWWRLPTEEAGFCQDSGQGVKAGQGRQVREQSSVPALENTPGPGSPSRQARRRGLCLPHADPRSRLWLTPQSPREPQ